MFELLEPIGARSDDELGDILAGRLRHAGVGQLVRRARADVTVPGLPTRPDTSLGPAPALWRHWLERAPGLAPRAVAVQRRPEGRSLGGGESEYWAGEDVQAAVTRLERSTELAAWGVVLGRAKDIAGMSSRRVWEAKGAGWALGDPLGARLAIHRDPTLPVPRFAEGPAFLLQVVLRRIGARQARGLPRAAAEALLTALALPLLAPTKLADSLTPPPPPHPPWRFYLGFYATHTRLQAALLLLVRGAWTAEHEASLGAASKGHAFKSKVASDLAARPMPERLAYLEEFTRKLIRAFDTELRDGRGAPWRDDAFPDETLIEQVYRFWVADLPPEQGSAIARTKRVGVARGP